MAEAILMYGKPRVLSDEYSEIFTVWAVAAVIIAIIMIVVLVQP